jgi:hypothetical protein
MESDNYKNLEQAINAIAQAIDGSTQLETNWIDLSYQNSWVDYGSTYVAGQYRRDKQGMVHLRGLVKNGSGVIATLPEGFRPDEKELIATATWSNTFGRVDIETNGQINPVTYNSNWVSLFNIHFKAVQ